MQDIFNKWKAEWVLANDDHRTHPSLSEFCPDHFYVITVRNNVSESIENWITQLAFMCAKSNNAISLLSVRLTACSDFAEISSHFTRLMGMWWFCYPKHILKWLREQRNSKCHKFRILLDAIHCSDEMQHEWFRKQITWSQRNRKFGTQPSRRD